MVDAIAISVTKDNFANVLLVTRPTVSNAADVELANAVHAIA